LRKKEKETQDCHPQAEEAAEKEQTQEEVIRNFQLKGWKFFFSHSTLN
jgi:hypothetical protein